jgi:hypothetical protein
LGTKGRTTVEQHPWWQVGLAILPGVMILVGTSLDNFGWPVRLPGSVALATFVLLCVSSVAWAVTRRRPLDVGVWGLVPLGLLALPGGSALTDLLGSLGRPLGPILVLLLGYGFSVASLLMFRRASWVRILAVTGSTLPLVLVVPLLVGWLGWGVEIYTPGQPLVRLMGWGGIDLYATLFLWVAVGVVFARHHGPAAGLFVLAGGLFWVSWHIEQEVFFWDQPTWSVVLELGVTVLFFILAPLWVLVSRSAAGQAAGLLAPVLAYVALLVTGLCVARGFPVGQSISIASPAMILCVALGAAIVLYAWTAEQAARAADVKERDPP